MCWLDGILWLLMGLPWSRVADPSIRSLTTSDASSPNLCSIPHDIGETHQKADYRCCHKPAVKFRFRQLHDVPSVVLLLDRYFVALPLNKNLP
jgi:hypothetical protein